MSTSSSTTARSSRTPKASSPAATATRRPAPSPSTRASRSTRPRCGGCSSRSSPTTARAGGGGSSARADRPRNDGGAGTRAGPASASGPDGRLAAIALAVDLDLLLGHGVGDLALLLDGVLVEAHALLGHRALLHDWLRGVQRDLVLLLGDRGAVGRVVDVGVADRLALDADLLALHGHRRLHLVGDDVLAQAGAAGLALGLADLELLLGARHGVVRGGAGRVMPDRALGAAVRLDVAVVVGAAGAALGQPGAGARLAVVQPVVLVERLLLGLRELTVGIDVGGVLDMVLLERDLHAITRRVGLL